MKLKNFLIIAFIVAALIGAKYIFFPPPSDATADSKTGKAGQVMPPSSVSAYIIKPEKLSNEVYATGSILANEEVVLQPEVSGKITGIFFKEGERVTKGQLLVKINDAELSANLKKLKLQFELAEQKLKRHQQLIAVNGISQEELDISQNQYNSIKADMEIVAAQIAKTEIKAPFEGIIGLKNISEGAIVTLGTNIASIQQINPLKIDFSIAEKYSKELKKGDKIVFETEGSSKEHNGIVYAIEPKIDIATRSIQIRALCPNNSEDLFPGAFAKIKLALKDIDSAYMLPTEAIIPDLKGKKVFRIKNGTAEPAKVVTGLRTNEKVQIVEGLQNGDTIITKGIMNVRPGAAVKITEKVNY